MMLPTECVQSVLQPTLLFFEKKKKISLRFVHVGSKRFDDSYVGRR